jgi:hypothetical protein
MELESKKERILEVVRKDAYWGLQTKRVELSLHQESHLLDMPMKC